VRERGSGSVLALAGVGVLAMVLAAGLQLAAVVAAAHRAHAAADLGALAGAEAVQSGAGQVAACAAAARIAEANGAAQAGCRLAVDGSVLVTTEEPLPPGLATFAGDTVRGIARAGPSP
jgi:secretion/DNA translocation related TadE-like protein